MCTRLPFFTMGDYASRVRCNWYQMHRKCKLCRMQLCSGDTRHRSYFRILNKNTGGFDRIYWHFRMRLKLAAIVAQTMDFHHTTTRDYTVWYSKLCELFYFFLFVSKSVVVSFLYFRKFFWKTFFCFVGLINFFINKSF